MPIAAVDLLRDRPPCDPCTRSAHTGAVKIGVQFQVEWGAAPGYPSTSKLVFPLTQTRGGAPPGTRNESAGDARERNRAGPATFARFITGHELLLRVTSGKTSIYLSRPSSSMVKSGILPDRCNLDLTTVAMPDPRIWFVEVSKSAPAIVTTKKLLRPRLAVANDDRMPLHTVCMSGSHGVAPESASTFRNMLNAPLAPGPIKIGS